MDSLITSKAAVNQVLCNLASPIEREIYAEAFQRNWCFKEAIVAQINELIRKNACKGKKGMAGYSERQAILQ